MLQIAAHHLDPFRNFDPLGTGAREWISILGMRHHILPNTMRPFRSMWWMYTEPNIDVWQSVNSNTYWAGILFPPPQLQYAVNHPLIHMICPAMINSTLQLTVWLRRHPDEAIAQDAYLPLPGNIWIHRLKDQRTVGKPIQISMITTPTQWRLALHFGYLT